MPDEKPKFIPYARQQVDDGDIEAVRRALTSPWLTTGPTVQDFEAALADVAGTAHAVAVSNGTAALHTALHGLGVGPGDTVIVPAMTFAASATAVLHAGARPVFADVLPDTLCIDPESAALLAAKGAKALMAVDYAGQPCDYQTLRVLARSEGMTLIADACHSLGALSQGVPAACLADAAVFSFHPAKHITTAEGGAVVLDDAQAAERMRRFRNHGIDRDLHQRSGDKTWEYAIVELGHNYRLSDLQCALGLSQIKRLGFFLERRTHAASLYDSLLADHPHLTGLVRPLKRLPGLGHAFHLYVVRVDFSSLGRSRQDVYARLHERGVGVNVHYIPVHLQPFFRRTLGTGPGQCPAAEQAYEEILSLPMHAGLTDADVARVVEELDLALTGGGS